MDTAAARGSEFERIEVPLDAWGCILGSPIASLELAEIDCHWITLERRPGFFIERREFSL
jgi:hypothetical protein